MKNSTPVALGLTAVLALFVAGCRNPQPALVKIPDQTPRETLKTPRLSDGGVVGGGETAGGETVSSFDLPDDDKLFGRDMDRSAFAAQTVYFEFDHANVRGDEASKVDQVAAAFKARGGEYDLLIEGHCDERGTEEYNRALGERRALSIRELLMKSGVDGKRVFTRSFGKDQPAEFEHTDAAWSKNRRGEFVLVLPPKITTTQLTQ